MHRSPRTRRLVAALLPALLVAFAGGCRATSRPAFVSGDAVVLDLPLVRQDALYDCGLVSISALCQFHSVHLPEELRADLARRAEASEGLSGAELRAALEGVGMEVYVYPSSLDRSTGGLLAQVDQGRPPLVMVSRDGKQHHYCLVLGYDERQGTVLLLDPLRGPVARRTEAFERDWERSQRFTLLAVPTPDVARK